MKKTKTKNPSGSPKSPLLYQVNAFETRKKYGDSIIPAEITHVRASKTH